MDSCHRLTLLGTFLAILVLAYPPALPALANSTLDRPYDPIVLTGADIPGLIGLDPGDLVAFRHDGGWQQIPVQVDERDVVEYSQVYNGLWGTGVFEEQYTDPNTFTGPDGDPTIDDDDEIVFMAKDAGGKLYPYFEPAGVVGGSGIEVRIEDPLDGGVGYVYLFEQTGSLDPAAGERYVSYDFNLLSGDYKETYLLNGGPGTSHGPQYNAEDSLVTTPFYERHWGWRWTNDELRITLGSGVDILEKSDYWIAEGSCGRHNATFNSEEGAFFANISGPVRAIRSYMGANSGPLTQRDHVYYEQREDVRTFLRVHERSATGIAYNDYSLAGIGTTYANSNNLAGITIDGVPNPEYVAGPISWEMITGPQGSMVVTHDVLTDIPDYFDGLTSYYHDELDTSVNICQECEEAPTVPCPEVVIISDQHLVGAQGPYGTNSLPSTDPRHEEFFHLTWESVRYYAGPGLVVKEAEVRRDWVSNPLIMTFTEPSAAVGGIAKIPAGLDAPVADSKSSDVPTPRGRILVMSGVLAASVVAATAAAWCVRRRRLP